MCRIVLLAVTDVMLGGTNFFLPAFILGLCGSYLSAYAVHCGICNYTFIN